MCAASRGLGNEHPRNTSKRQAGRRRIVHVIVKQYLLLNHLKIPQFSGSLVTMVHYDKIHKGIQQVTSAKEVTCESLQHLNGE